MQVRQDPAALAEVDRSIEILVRENHVHQVMDDQSPFFPGGLGRADVQLPINLEGIGADNLRSQFLG
jgi:hypothetical protein